MERSRPSVNGPRAGLIGVFEGSNEAGVAITGKGFGDLCRGQQSGRVPQFPWVSRRAASPLHMLLEPWSALLPASEELGSPVAWGPAGASCAGLWVYPIPGIPMRKLRQAGRSALASGFRLWWSTLCSVCLMAQLRPDGI